MKASIDHAFGLADRLQEAQHEIERLKEAMTGWRGYGWRNGEYHDSIQEYFDSALDRQTHEN